MIPEELKNVVKFIDNFVNFSDDEIAEIKDVIEFVHLKKNDIFIDEGQIAKTIAFTNKGYLRVYYNHDGEEAPDVCPKCGAPKEKFTELDNDAEELVHKSRITNDIEELKAEMAQ